MQVIDCEYRFKNAANTRFDNLEEPHFQKRGEFGIHYIIEGDGYFRINGDKYALRNNSLFVTFPGDNFSFLLSKFDILFSYYIISIKLDESDTLLQNLLDIDIRSKQAYYPKRNFRNIFDELAHDHLSRSPYLAQASNHLVIGILYELLDSCQEQSTSTYTSEYIEKAIDWMHAHIHERATLTDLCNHLHLSEAHFIRIFRDNLGIPPMKFFMRLKIYAAANQLHDTTSPIYEISESFEFNSPGHFCRTFKQHMGMSPFQYRNSQAMDLEAKERIYQQRLEEAYILLQTVVDASPDLIFIKNVNGIYLSCNAAFCNFTGLSKEKIIGRSDSDIHQREKADFFIKHDIPIFRYNRAFKNEETLVFPNGKTRLYQVYKAPFHDSTGKVLGLIGISRDITDLKNNLIQATDNRDI